jgi:hypothetical protein
MPRNWLKYFVSTLEGTPISMANLLILREESKRRVYYSPKMYPPV